jgi:hypothetical protein
MDRQLERTLEQGFPDIRRGRRIPRKERGKAVDVAVFHAAAQFIPAGIRAIANGIEPELGKIEVLLKDEIVLPVAFIAPYALLGEMESDGEDVRPEARAEGGKHGIVVLDGKLAGCHCRIVDVLAPEFVCLP